LFDRVIQTCGDSTCSHHALDNPPALAFSGAPGALLMTEEYTATTRGIRIVVRSFYLDDQSSPDDGRYVWAYRIRIENHGHETVQLLRRTWNITDGRGRTQRVHGAGVIGEQPTLEPGESFEYTSGTPLDTPTGFMSGLYHMVVSHTGEAFDVVIPAFSLDSPHQHGRVH
jgi:ApaG protein